MIRSRLDYAWRIAATGFSFALFGLGGSAIGIAAFLLVFPLPMARQKKYTIMRRLVNLAFRFYLAILRLLGLLTSEFHGLEKLKRRSCLVVANHPSLLDVVMLISVIPRANCIIKQGVRENKFTFFPSYVAGFITNQDEDMLGKCRRSLAEGDTLIIFPEGTRSRPGEPVELMRGFANIALAANHNITPVLITCYPPTLMKGRPWYEIPVNPPHFTITVLDDLDISPYRDELPSKASRQLAKVLATRYNQLLGLG